MPHSATSRIETIPTARSPSTIGRWRKPWSNIVFAASSMDVSAAAVTGSAVIHSRTRASLEWVRAATACMMSRSVRTPISRPKSKTTTEPTLRSTMRAATRAYNASARLSGVRFGRLQDQVLFLVGDRRGPLHDDGHEDHSGEGDAEGQPHHRAEAVCEALLDGVPDRHLLTRWERVQLGERIRVAGEDAGERLL